MVHNAIKLQRIPMKIFIYCPEDPGDLLHFLETEQKNSHHQENQYHLFVNNNDNKTAYEFYALRKYIRKGMNLSVHIHPSFKNPSSDQTPEDIIEFLKKEINLEPNFDFIYFNRQLTSVKSN